MQRQESERSTGHPVRSILALTMPAVLDLAENSHPADATTRVANEAVQIYTARLSVSSQPTIRSTTFSISVAITSLPPNTELPGCKHSGCGRKLAAALPLRYKSPTLLAQPRESSRPRPNKLPVPDRLLLHPIIVHPIINEDAGRDFRHRQRRCFRRDSTDTQMRCSSTAGTPTGRRPSTTASNMGCLAGSAGLRKRRDYLIAAQAYALISSPTAISMMTGVFHFIAVFLDLILAGGKSRVAAKRRRIRQT